MFDKLKQIYGNDEVASTTLQKLTQRLQKYQVVSANLEKFSEKDTVLITYGDSLQQQDKKGLPVLTEFLQEYVKDAIETIHILPMYPYTSDDGFSVTDYLDIHQDLGSWDDVKGLANHYSLMFDAVINHISRHSDWFQKYLAGDKSYDNYFITADPQADYSSVVRPRTLPLLTKVDTKTGESYVWTTFSDDQIDLNYQNPDVLIEIADILVQYAKYGAKYIRLDAIGFLWKQLGTSCMHLPQTHAVIKLYRQILSTYAPGTMLITETNVAHMDNISYFGNGYDEAQLVYQFPLPPLVLHSFLRGNAKALSEWASTLTLPSDAATFFNFLSSHDGIGLRPIDGILTTDEKEYLVHTTFKHGGDVSYKDNGDGTQSPYELNINYQDALSHPDESDAERIAKLVAAETILLSMQGVPALYIHSLLGSRNDYLGAHISKIPRRINREKIDVNYLKDQLSKNTNRNKIFTELISRLKIRKEHAAFSPLASQTVKMVDERVFYIIRESKNKKEKIHAVINVSSETVTLDQTRLDGVDLISKQEIKGQIKLKSWDCVWVLEK
jgi:sucrose phosphorylase